jgi:hypothetical protein
MTLAALLTVARGADASVIFSESFDAGVPAGWTVVNNSFPVGTTNWFQGNPGVFAAQDGSPDGYVAANFENASPGGAISDWLITPVISVEDGDVFAFYTRVTAGSPFPDRLEVRFNPTGSTDVGNTFASVGDFTTLLLTINPALGVGGYPESWTLFQVALSGLGGVTDGRFGFRYTIPDTNSWGDYVGIDTVSVSRESSVPEPGTLALAAFGLGAMTLWTRVRKVRR